MFPSNSMSNGTYERKRPTQDQGGRSCAHQLLLPGQWQSLVFCLSHCLKLWLSVSTKKVTNLYFQHFCNWIDASESWFFQGTDISYHMTWCIKSCSIVLLNIVITSIPTPTIITTIPTCGLWTACSKWQNPPILLLCLMLHCKQCNAKQYNLC